MAEDIINTFIKGFTKFQEDDQLKRAKDTEKDFRKMNDATLIWVKDCCERILTERKSLSTSPKAKELNSDYEATLKVCPRCKSQKVSFSENKYCCDSCGNISAIGQVWGKPIS